MARVTRSASPVLAALALSLLSGCQVERIVLEEPVRNQFVEVCTDDHVVVRLDEPASDGFRWTATCANPLVDVTIEREEASDCGSAGGPSGNATVHLRVRRGFLGPAAVYLRLVRGWSGTCARTVRLQLHRRPTDVAVWK